MTDAASASLRPDLALVPRPDSVTPLPGRFILDHHTGLRAGPGAEAAADLLREMLTPTTGLPLATDAGGRISLLLTSGQQALGAEGYVLTVRPDSVLLSAARPDGLLRGIQTLRQLLPPEALAAEGARPRTPASGWSLPCVRITDRPRFAWRGAMLDVARYFQPVSYVRRFVDLLALHKLNVLHLHLTDDQGWRMPVAAYPRLTEIGGRRAESEGDGIPHEGAYTRAELAGLVAYAARRGVSVVPEIEMPGHARAALAAYPELGNRPGVRLEPWTRWGVCENVFGVHDAVLDFCRGVLDEVADVFPGPYVHLGGDECPRVEWERSPAARDRITAEGLAGPGALHGWFLGAAAEHLAKLGRRPLGWTGTGTELPTAFTAMAWLDTEHGRAAALRGHDVIMAPYRSTYLDYPQSTDPGEPRGQDGVLDLRGAYDNEPAPAHWEPEAARRVLGTQAQLWTEYARTPAELEYLAFPRLCALADTAWSAHRDWPDYLRRQGHHQTRLDALGVRGRSLPPHPERNAPCAPRPEPEPTSAARP
ncbi:beta-N-acetylhexosaminidase [Streptomyces sp. H34-S4]|uniref:beta-N-acetylhexosaminidase n=1 Tax=Streptomyces sp. H34-S4 TaxID=2996463 RepID=UPI00226D73EF|nr:beta-N-acetylhexosaminidase [Streptomyces sp. H34-S4]MCY0938473.1 beta-N-acetylhexosaminidase [Streptomyces sp. H34-S4]